MVLLPILYAFKLWGGASSVLKRKLLLLVASGKIDSYSINMNLLEFTILTVPVSGATILMNMFFVYCMFFPENGTKNSLKPPLNVLLGSLIGCNLTLNVFNLLFVLFDHFHPATWLYTISYAVTLFAMRTSFTSSLGLNVFYYFQIVPVRQAFLVWVKTHIKVFMYLTLFFDRIFFSFEFVLEITYPLEDAVPAADLNLTSVQVNITNGNMDLKYFLLTTNFWLNCGYFFLGVVIMLASSSATVLYLWSHMKSMRENISSFSALHLQRQMRVTIMGVLQTVLYFISSGWLTAEDIIFYYFVEHFDQGEYLCDSVVALYSLGTTIILCVGQTIFRLRVIDIWKKLLQTLKFSSD
ncbi:taste receptor type 2 member 10-like [Myxocyprinus asiaticus]|uniref:taste receptor type 2 member 10-like n=1 Tax=Myxocyprinus asiaticus TaxID=70543 RepID=UPI0022236CDB|nr:taste receptor type 2 member 10-like [Myxocyprinus asiaticus]